jgi:DNA-nicking Smr family endonuclease
MLKMLKEELVDPDKLGNPSTSRKKEGKIIGSRSSVNTVDVRGLGVSDAQTAAYVFMQEIAEREGRGGRGRMEVLFVNHGNTKEAAEPKLKLRQWLKKHPLVTRMHPAELSDGGDAFTVVEIDMQ